jgi:hypothetical protein
MFNVLAPRWPRGGSLVWVSLVVGILATPAVALAQDAKTKGDESKKAAAAKAEPAGDAQKGVVDTKKKRQVVPPETYEDPRAADARKGFRELYGNVKFSTNDEKMFDQMVAGQGNRDQDLASRFVRTQAGQLTKHANIKNLEDLTAKPEAAKKIEEATARLIKPLLAANIPDGVRKAYVAEIVAVAPEVLKNHLFARNAIMIVLKESGDPQAFAVYRAVLKDPNQVLVAKVSAAEGIAKAMTQSQQKHVQISGQEAGSTADALAKFLQEEPTPYWWAQWRALRAIGLLRQATAKPADGKPEIAELALKLLSDPKARPEVRAYAGWALGMMQVPTQVKNFNYRLVAHQIAQLASEVGDRVSALRKDELPRATQMAHLLVLLYEAFSGNPDVGNDSGLLRKGPDVAGIYADKVKTVAVSGVEVVRAAGTQLGDRQKVLNAAIADLKATVNAKPPTDRSIVPGAQPILAEAATSEPKPEKDTR